MLCLNPLKSRIKQDTFKYIAILNAASSEYFTYALDIDHTLNIAEIIITHLKSSVNNEMNLFIKPYAISSLRLIAVCQSLAAMYSYIYLYVGRSVPTTSCLNINNANSKNQNHFIATSLFLLLVITSIVVDLRLMC